jgi:hypothetical protein
MAQALLELGRLFVAQDGSIVGGQLPLLGPQEPLPSGGGGPMGGSRPPSAVVPALVGPPESIMALLNLDRGLGNRLTGGLDQLVGGSDALPDPRKRPRASRLRCKTTFHDGLQRRPTLIQASMARPSWSLAFPGWHKRCGISLWRYAPAGCG